MRSASRPASLALVALALLALAIGLAACGSTSPAPAGSTAATAARTPLPTSRVTAEPEPTVVPGGASGQPSGPGGPAPTLSPTTGTDWGIITDGLPEGFPVFPDARIADWPSEPVSGAFLAPASVDETAAWYRNALEATGKSTVNLSSPFEDGSRVLDMQGDLPECRLRLTFRPQDGSTMITVLYGAGCAGGQG